MSLNETPVHVSEPSGRNLWQKYYVYPDRLELRSRPLLKTLDIIGNKRERLEHVISRNKVTRNLPDRTHQATVVEDFSFRSAPFEMT